MGNYGSYTEAVWAALAGNQDAFAWLYEKTSKEKYYIAIKYMKDQTEASDVLQDAYMKAWQSLRSLEDPEKFPGWVGQIVANTALSALRKKRPVTFSDMSGENEDGEEFVYDIEDESIERQPELNYTTNERQEIIRAMIDSLTDEQRMCVMMFYIEEMSVKEIAATLGCSENTVKSRLNYGRKNIKHEADELKKRGYSFYSIAPLPLLLMLLKSEKASAMGVTAASAATAGTTGTVATTTADVVGTAAAGTAGKAAGGFISTVVGKIVAGVAVVATLGAVSFGTYQVVKSINGSDEPADTMAVSESAVVLSGGDVMSDGAVSSQAVEVEKEGLDQFACYDLYADYLEKHKSKIGFVSVLDVDADETPEILVRTKEHGEVMSFYDYYLLAVHDGQVVRSDLVSHDSHYSSGMTWRYMSEKRAILFFGDPTSDMENYYSESINVFVLGDDGKATEVNSDEYDMSGSSCVRFSDYATVKNMLTKHLPSDKSVLGVFEEGEVYDVGDDAYFTLGSGGFGYDEPDKLRFCIMRYNRSSGKLSVVTDDISLHGDTDIYQGDSGLGYTGLIVYEGYIYARLYGPGTVDSEDGYTGDEIYRISPDGKERKLIAEHVGYQAHLTIKNGRLYYALWGKREFESYKNAMMYSVNLDGSDRKKEKNRDAGYFDPCSVYWSPVAGWGFESGYLEGDGVSYGKAFAGDGVYEVSKDGSKIFSCGKKIYSIEDGRKGSALFAHENAVIFSYYTKRKAPSGYMSNSENFFFLDVKSGNVVKIGFLGRDAA